MKINNFFYKDNDNFILPGKITVKWEARGKKKLK